MPKNVTSFRMTNKMNCFKRFQPEVESFGMAMGLSPKIIFKMTLVLDELVSNIINYGYADFNEHPIDVTITYQDSVVTIQVEDDAKPFNILEAPVPELHKPLEDRERPIGGMGVHLVKSMVDSLSYERVQGKNILVLTKRLCEDCCCSSRGE